MLLKSTQLVVGPNNTTVASQIFPYFHILRYLQMIQAMLTFKMQQWGADSKYDTNQILCILECVLRR